jgi:hypothetical protein
MVLNHILLCGCSHTDVGAIRIYTNLFERKFIFNSLENFRAKPSLIVYETFGKSPFFYETRNASCHISRAKFIFS